MVEFGEQLRRAREKTGLTQQTLAEKLYVTRQTVSHWECGDRYPDLLTTKRLSDILEVSLDDLLSGNEMDKVVERNPVVENRVANNVMIFFYAVIIFSLVSIIGREVLTTDWKYITGWAVRCNDVATVVRTVCEIVCGILQVLIFTYGLVHSIKVTLSPKRIGTVIAAYYAIFFIESLVIATNDITMVQRNSASMVGTPNFVPYYFDCLLGIIGAVAAVLYFIRKNEKVIVPVMLVGVSVWKMIDAIKEFVEYVIYMAGRFNEANQFHDAIPYQDKLFIYRVAFGCVSVLLICGMIIYQVVTLHRKRKIASEITADATA